jgi:hypothetical protein
MGKENKINLTADQLITELEEHETIMGKPTIDKGIVVGKIVELQQNGSLTEEQQQRIARIDYLDNGDEF